MQISQVGIQPTRRQHFLSIWEHCMLPDKILPVQWARWTANTVRNEVQDKNGLLFFFHVLIWMTWQQIMPKQTLGDNSCSFGWAYRLTAQLPEKTLAAHGMSLPCRRGGGACECPAMSEKQTSFHVIRKILLLEQREIHGLAIDSAHSSPAVAVYWPLTSLLCWGDTCRVLTASWQTRFLNSWLDGGAPNKTHRSAHILWKGVKAVCVCACDCVSTNCVCHWTHFWCVCANVCMFVCAEFISTYKGVKSKQPGEVWINRRSWQTGSTTAADSSSQTAGQSMPLFQYISVCRWVCIENTFSFLSAPWGCNLSVSDQVRHCQNVNVINLKQCDNLKWKWKC